MNDFKFRKNFISSLNELLKGNLELVESLDIILKSDEFKDKIKILRLKRDIQNGKKLKESFKNISSNKKFLNLINSADKTGNLKKCIELLDKNYKLTSNLISEIMVIICYPLLIVVISLLVFALMLIFVIPKFSEIYVYLEKEIPNITKIMISISNFYINNFYLINLIIISIIISFIIIIKTFKINFDFLIFLPFFKEFYILFFTQNMSLCLSSKLNFLESLFICMEEENVYLKKDLMKIYKKIERGNEISKAFNMSSFFNKEYITFLSIADKIGNVEECFENICTLNSARLKKRIKIFLKLFEPLSILFIAFMIGFILLSIMLPLFSI